MKRLIVGLTGASGAIYAVRALQLLRAAGDLEIHLVMSASGMRTLVEETDQTPDDLRALAHVTHSHKDIGASIASGSFRTAGMLIAPCSVKSLSSIAYSLNENLVSRAADVCLKERRRVVLLVRETPLHLGHLAAMEQATRNGAVVMPPVPSFYHRPQTLLDVVDQTVGRALDLFDIEIGVVKRWTETEAPEVPLPLSRIGS